MAFLYSRNAFDLHIWDAPDRFVTRAPSARLASLRKISFLYRFPLDQQDKVYEIAFARKLVDRKLRGITIYADDDS